MRWSIWGLTVLVMATVMGVIVLPPWLEQPWRQMIMTALDPYCHQIAERSPHINGIQLAVCHRCFGIYAGLFLGPWVMLATRRWDSNAVSLLLALSLTPMAVDWMLNVAGVLANTPVSRITTGASFGMVAGVLIVRGVAEYSAKVDTEKASACALPAAKGQVDSTQ